MITLEDCAAFCAAKPEMVNDWAHCENLTMVMAYARAHNAVLCANDSQMLSGPSPADDHNFRVAA